MLVGLDIADRIDVTVSAADDVWTIVERHRDYVLAEVLALSLARADHGDHKLDLDGAPLQVTLAKA
jgi:hypothetical protein